MEPLDQPLNNFELFIEKANKIIDSDDPEKLDKLNRLILANGEFLGKYPNPAVVDPMKDLASRLKGLLSPEEASRHEKDEKIAALAAQFIEYAADFKLLPELMQVIVGQFVEDETGDWRAPSTAKSASLRMTSKEVRRQTMQAYRAPLQVFLKKERFGYVRAEDAIAFAEQFGRELTYIDLKEMRFTPAQLRTLLSHLSALRTLSVNSLELGSEGLQAILEATTLGNLETLNLWYNNLGDDGCIALARATNLPRLRELNIGNNRITKEGIAKLVQSPLAKKLETLTIAGNPLGDEGIQAFALAAIFENLRYLDMNLTECTATGADAVSNCASLTTLKILNISYNPIKDQGAFSIGNSKTLANLLQLILTSCGLTGVGAAHLVPLTNLELLNLNDNWVDDTGAIAIANRLKKLQILQIANYHPAAHGGMGDITDVGVEALATLENLRFLDLVGNAITSRGACALAFSDAMRNLNELHLQGNQIDDLGTLALALREWPNLQVLKIFCNQITKWGEAEAAYKKKWVMNDGKAIPK